jgi:hypothetical protein
MLISIGDLRYRKSPMEIKHRNVIPVLISIGDLRYCKSPMEINLPWKSDLHSMLVTQGPGDRFNNLLGALKQKSP